MGVDPEEALRPKRVDPASLYYTVHMTNVDMACDASPHLYDTAYVTGSDMAVNVVQCLCFIIACFDLCNKELEF